MGTTVNAAVNQGASSAAPSATTPAAAVAAPKVSWLKRFGHVVAEILGFAANNAKPVADAAAQVAEIIMPQFAPEIEAADGLVGRIAKFASVQEAVSSSLATAQTGPQKLAAVTAQIGPEIDAWVEANFPGAAKAGDLEKQGLVNAVVALINKAQQAATPAAT